jgi:hypothetical protein
MGEKDPWVLKGSKSIARSEFFKVYIHILLISNSIILFPKYQHQRQDYITTSPHLSIFNIFIKQTGHFLLSLSLKIREIIEKGRKKRVKNNHKRK